MIQESKPVVCAIYPLGRIWDSRDQKHHYFIQSVPCQDNTKPNKLWTLQEWLDTFKIKESEAMSAAWSRLMGGRGKCDCSIDRK